MKLFFKLFFPLMIITNVSSRDIIIAKYKYHNKEQVNFLTTVIQDHLKLPSHYLRFEISNEPCKKEGSSIVQLCLNEGQNEWKIVHVNQKVSKKYLSVLVE